MRIQQIAFHITHIPLHRSSRRLQYPPAFPKTDSPRLLVVPPTRHSYGSAAIQCHLSSLGPSNRPVSVFPLDQKPRWLQPAGVRGKASSIKTGMESDDMEYTGFKISLCCKTVQIDLPLFMCSSNKCSRMWGGNHNLNNGETLTESLFSPSHTYCFHVAVVFEREAEHWSHFCVNVCLCMCACCDVCLLCVISPVTMTEEPLYKVCNEKAVCSHCSLPAFAVGQAD